MNSNEIFIREEKVADGDLLAKLFELLDRWDRSSEEQKEKRCDTSHNRAVIDTVFFISMDKGRGKLGGKDDGIPFT